MPLLHITGYEWLDWHPHLDVIFGLLLLEGGYLYAITGLRSRISDAGRVKRSRVILFTLGVLFLYAGAGSPVHDIGEQYLLSVHMLQHLLFTLAAAPLLLVGIPDWLLRPLLNYPAIARTARIITHPVFALAFFTVVLLLTHLPPIMDAALRHHEVHLVTHVVLTLSGLVMWWPIFSPMPELPRLSYPLQMVYLFLQSLLPVVMASFVTFSDRVVYKFYAQAPRIWGMSPIADQQIAGVVMKILGGLILWSFIAMAFFRWYAKEEVETTATIKREEIEEELKRMGLMKQ